MRGDIERLLIERSDGVEKSRGPPRSIMGFAET